AQQSGFGAMVSFEIAGGTDAVELLASRLECFTLAESLGGVESLVAHPATMTHASMDAAARADAGITDSLVRLSVGIESAEDLVRDLTAALDAVAASGQRVAVAPVARVESRVNDPAHTPADVVVLGAGAIARELIAQVNACREHSGAPLRIAAVVDRSGFVVAEGGIPRATLDDLCTWKRAGHSLATFVRGRTATPHMAFTTISRVRLNRPILVDATATDTTELLHTALRRGFDIVLANKVPIAGGQGPVDRLRDLAHREGRRILYEATVGAGLPVIDTLRRLAEAGDDVLSVEGCPSGTLGFLFAELSNDVPFSQALAAAVASGYTEPDPRIDLSGIDVARKALILARDIGYRGELSDVTVESLVPAQFATTSREDFLLRASELDSEWRTRVERARAGGKVLRYRARVTPDAITVGLVEVPAGDPLGTLTGTDNQFTFTTTRYRTNPLVITGPGAGAAVTAAGVLNDVLTAERAPRLERGITPDHAPERRAASLAFSGAV
ncbi:MAG TPA: PLP-dependent transferase, partial [Gemmatimonadaceae bacterium]|nr:PLP-dependent transferase [Gemmatimonadaceae bacterium]